MGVSPQKDTSVGVVSKERKIEEEEGLLPVGGRKDAVKNARWKLILSSSAPRTQENYLEQGMDLLLTNVKFPSFNYSAIKRTELLVTK